MKNSISIKSTVFINKRKNIQELYPLFRKWLSLNKAYCDAYPNKDCLYWYNERAAISSLAGAVWKCNGLASEEFHADKKYGRSIYSGRSDLWFSFKKNRKDYLIEAKYEIFSLPANTGKKLSKRVDDNLNSALRDVEASKDGAKILLGVVFMVPRIPPSAEKNKKFLLKDFFKTVTEMDAHIITIFLTDYIIKDPDNYSYPGVALIGKLKPL